ncbi:IS4 family transposase [Neolewinella persica]|uniref:IS4 family transposase n=1 Tax=Neolewinella persica TaxID=70998 RepID=UPI000399E155|nr:IS4 family transposase [Neolewinella persica]
MESARTFFPIGRHSFQPGLKNNQRYRNSFGDLRLSRRYKRMVASMQSRRTGKAYHLGTSRTERAAIYRFLSNDRVTLAELIRHSTQLDTERVTGRDVLCLLNACSISLGLSSRNEVRLAWADECGVINNNRTAGFNVMPSLLLDRNSGDCLGMGDLLIYSRAIASSNKDERDVQRKLREALDIEHKESASWLYSARNTAMQLEAAMRCTFVMDQGGDQYEVLQHLLAQTGAEFIVRSKIDRQAKDLEQERYGKMSYHLSEQPIWDERLTPIRALNHYSKSSGEMVVRTARAAQLELRAIKVKLDKPRQLKKHTPLIDQPLYLVEVRENESTVPAGEKPIHWKLLTTWEVEDKITALQVVDAYRSRWHVEQLFRVLKKSGVDIEKSQLDKPEKIKKLLVMALKASVDAIRLTNVRSGESFVPIEEMFNEEDRKILVKMNVEMSSQGTKVINSHDPESLAWAAWVIARIGGWDGYQSQRPPGPITMQRGLQELDRARFYATIFRGP